MTREVDDTDEQTIAGAYYDEITYAHLIELVGMDAASNYYILKRQMEEAA